MNFLMNSGDHVSWIYYGQKDDKISGIVSFKEPASYNWVMEFLCCDEAYAIVTEEDDQEHTRQLETVWAPITMVEKTFEGKWFVIVDYENNSADTDEMMNDMVMASDYNQIPFRDEDQLFETMIDRTEEQTNGSIETQEIPTIIEYLSPSQIN